MVLLSKLSLVSLTSFFFLFFSAVVTSEEEKVQNFTYYSSETNVEPAKFVFQDFQRLFSFHREKTEALFTSTFWTNVPEKGIVLKFIDSHEVTVGEERLSGSGETSRVVSAQKVGIDRTLCSMRRVKRRCDFIGKRLTLTFENDSTLEFRTLYDLPKDFTGSLYSQIVVLPPAGLAVGMYGFYIYEWRYYVSVESNSRAVFFYSFHNPHYPYFFLVYNLRLSQGSLL